MLKIKKRSRISTKSLVSLTPPQQFRYLKSEPSEWNTITDKKPGVVYYMTNAGYMTFNNKIDGIRVILKPL